MLEMLLGAGIFAAGVAIGRFLPNRRRRGELGERKPVCACGHAVSFHGEDGCCRATKEVSKWDGGRWVGNVQEPCECQRYTGPQPLPSFYAPEISD
ncbi:hypothetical protein ABN034_14900 [Actinopolymorpha sp. B11F2]|uniref:hypothetical protein n=1 Tax=Actinopolymorpha sp. B11F2 TaxID=3160862 RepID=UPI0032E372EF